MSRIPLCLRPQQQERRDEEKQCASSLCTARVQKRLRESLLFLLKTDKSCYLKCLHFIFVQANAIRLKYVTSVSIA
jgi:hypothetical protein